MSKHSELVYANDTLRKQADIRNRPVKELSSYQRTQLVQINRKLQDYRELDLSKAVKRTLDGTLLQDYETDPRNSYKAELIGEPRVLELVKEVI